MTEVFTILFKFHVLLILQIFFQIIPHNLKDIKTVKQILMMEIKGSLQLRDIHMLIFIHFLQL